MGCSISDQIIGYKSISKKLRELNPKVEPVRLQHAINDYWLGLENNIMTESEKKVYKILVEQTDGMARIGLGGNNQLNEPIVVIKDLGNEYVIHLESGKNYTFAKGKINSKTTAKGQSVTMEAMVLTDPKQRIYLQDKELDNKMAYSIKEQNALVEAAKSEYKRLADLKNQGYEQDLENDIYDIEEAMNNMRAVIYRKPENTVESEVQVIDEIFINELNKNNPKDGKVKIQILSGVKTAKGKLIYTVKYPNNDKEYKLPASRIIADQMSASNWYGSTAKTEYQISSKFPSVYSAYTEKEKKLAVILKDISKDIKDNLKELYPDVTVITEFFSIKDENNNTVLGKAVGSILHVSNVAHVDTLPHEYAHIYINTLENTPAISNVLNRLEKSRKASRDEAKEILATYMGELYVEDELNKLNYKTKSMIERLWQYIIDTFNKIVNKDKYLKELDELNGIKIVVQDFKTGKFKEEFASKLIITNDEVFVDSKATVGTVDKLDLEANIYASSPELQKYGTLEDYKKYTETIFPDSSVKDILAHDTGTGYELNKKEPFTDSWMYENKVEISGKGENFGLVSGEGFYMYKPEDATKTWDEYAPYTGYMKVNMKKPLYSTAKEYLKLQGKSYYEKMANLTNTEVQSNPDTWYMLDNPPEKVTINSIVNSQTGYDGFVNEVRPGLFEYVAWNGDQVHILGSKYDISNFKKYMEGNYSKGNKVSITDNNTALLFIPDIKLPDIEGFNIKNEFHITVLGFAQSKYLTKEATSREEGFIKEVHAELSKIDPAYTLKDDYRLVSRDREVWIDWKDQSKGKTVIHEESVIQLVDAPGIVQGIKNINKKFNLNLPIPYPHVTIAVNGGLGIGIASKEEFDKLDTTEVELKDNTEDEYKSNVKGSDQNTGIGESVNDEFIGQEETDLGQVLADDFAAYYDVDVQEGREIQTQEFDDLQNTLVDIYQKTMKDLGTGNVKLRMFENLVEPTAGQIDLRTKEMQIRWNKMSRLSRVSEVFLHEVNHLMSSHVFKENIKLRRLMEDLRNSALDSGVTYKLFLEGIQNPTKEEIEIAKMKFEYTFDKTANVEEFYAYATTNEQVYNAIKNVKITTKLVKEVELEPGKKQPFKKVLNKLIKTVNDIWKLLSGRGETGGKMIVDMIHTIARLDAEQTQKNWKDESGDIGLTDYAKNKISQLDEKLEPVIKKVEEWNEKLSAKQGASWLGEKIKQIPVLNDLLETGISQYLWRMVTQDTTANDVADMYMVFRHSKQVVEKHTADIRNGVKAVADELYKDLDKETKNAITKIVLEADLAQFSATEIKAFIEDSEKLDSEIGKLMVALKPKNERMKQIEGLAEYLVSGKTVLHNQQMNANNIVTGLYKEQKKYKRANREDVKLVDKLVSLIALKNSDRVQVELLRNVDNEVLDKTINMYRGYIDNMRANATLDAHDPIPKGYIRPEDGLIKYELIPEEEVKAQESVLMKLVDEKPYAVVEGRKYYLMTGRTKSVGFNEGAIGLISHTTEGIPVSSLIRKNNELSGKLELMDGELKRKTRNIILAISRKEPDVMKKFHLDSGQTLVPVYDHQNNLVDYRIQLTKLEKEMYLTDRKTELEDVLSHTFSRSIKTSLTATENKRVVDTIIEHSAAGVLERPQDYVLVEEYTEEDRLNGVKREKRHDRWEYLPDHTKDYIFQKTKNKGILIHKDFVELMTGEKDVTIGNFAKFGIDLKKYPVARARLMALESYLAEILGYVKNAMVVLNADVLLGNQTSNAIVAITHGIDPIEYAKKFKTRWQQLNDYNEKSQQLAELEVKRMAGENVENRIKQLKRQLEGNIWDELVKDGQYTALVEDINIEGQGEGQLLTMAKNYLEKKNWLGAVNAVKNVLYINKTTNLYNSMLKTVHYGDAITRQIIKEELEKKAIKRDGKVTKETEREILNYLDQLLVNYGYTMNRWWKYAERVGGLFFMKYYLSQAKAIISLTKRNPAKTLLMQGAQRVTGLDFQDPFDTYLRSGIDGIGYRWMLDDAPEQILQPNIFDLIPSLDSIVKIR